jgi:hypothetical protein
MAPAIINESSSLSQGSVPVRYAHLHCALGEGGKKQNNNQQRFQSTKFILGLDRKTRSVMRCRRWRLTAQGVEGWRSGRIGIVDRKQWNKPTIHPKGNSFAKALEDRK